MSNDFALISGFFFAHAQTGGAREQPEGEAHAGDADVVWRD